MGQQTGVFISYRRSDAPGHAGRLRDELVRSRRPTHVFMDVDSIRPGSDFTASIDSALEDTKVMLVIIGPSWAAARDSSGSLRLQDPEDFVRREVKAALDQGVLTIPVLVGGAAMPAPDDLPEELRALAYREAFELRDARWGRDVADLASYLDGLSAARTPRRYRAEEKRGRAAVPIAVAVAVAVLIAGAVVLVPRLLGPDDNSTARGPTEATTGAVSSAPTTTAPTEDGPSTAPPRSTAAGLRQVFTGITARHCDDTTGSWPGVDDFDAKQVIGCDFHGYRVDFHQWLNAREMRRYESASYRTFRRWTEKNTHWRITTGGPIGGDYYVWAVDGGYELLWTVDDLLMSGRMFAPVHNATAIENIWASNAGVHMDKARLS